MDSNQALWTTHAGFSRMNARLDVFVSFASRDGASFADAVRVHHRVAERPRSNLTSIAEPTRSRDGGQEADGLSPWVDRNAI
jgi:hypothetical protein